MLLAAVAAAGELMDRFGFWLKARYKRRNISGVATSSSFPSAFMGGRKYFAPFELANQSDAGTMIFHDYVVHSHRNLKGNRLWILD